MAESKKDRIARQVADLRVAFDLALSDKRKYPAREFNGFLEKCAPLYRDRRWGLDDTQSVAQAVNGLREFLQVERKRIPGNVLFEADRLHISKQGSSLLRFLLVEAAQAAARFQSRVAPQVSPPCDAS
jgi:hypothetical protein